MTCGQMAVSLWLGLAALQSSAEASLVGHKESRFEAFQCPEFLSFVAEKSCAPAITKFLHWS